MDECGTPYAMIEWAIIMALIIFIGLIINSLRG
jgi:hypothetical protein